jgi:hypothetical protein
LFAHLNHSPFTIRAQVGNNSTGLRRIWVRLQGTAGTYSLCTGGCNAADGRKDKQGGGIIACLRPYVMAFKPFLQTASHKKPLNILSLTII